MGRKPVDHYYGFDAFRSALNATAATADAQVLVVRAPSPSDPAHHWYSNLGFFLGQGFAIPGGASADELRLYAAAVRRWTDVNDDARERVARSLEAAADERP